MKDPNKACCGTQWCCEPDRAVVTLHPTTNEMLGSWKGYVIDIGAQMAG